MGPGSMAAALAAVTAAILVLCSAKFNASTRAARGRQLVHEAGIKER
jgi:hypothetical protein